MEIIKIIWENQPVLTTAQLAAAYKTKPKNIHDNFARAQEYFEPGKHYFKLTAEPLRQFKRNAEKNGFAIHPSATRLYLWTYKGCLHHCKMLNTPEAWTVFNELEKAYFAVHDVPKIEPPAAVSLFENDLQVQLAEVTNQLAQSTARNNRLLKQISSGKSFDLAAVYCLLTSEGSVKIGYTSNLTERIKAIKLEFKLDILDYYSTGFMGREEAAALEERIKAEFADCSLGNEFYDVRFADVREAISTAKPTA